MRFVTFIAFLIAACSAGAVSIDAIYFGQTHMHKSDNPYFGTVGGRDVFIKVHVTDPATPASPAVFATLNLAGQFLTVQLTGPATLPASIPDGLGVVQHSTANSFTGVLPAAWISKGLQVTVNVGAVTSTVTDMKVSAPTTVIMTMTDVHYFSKTTGDYTSGSFAEIEAKWPVKDLEVRRLNNVVFRELVIPPRSDVSAQAVRIRSKAEYAAQTGLTFDGEQAAALEWNGALKRATGRDGRWSLYYLNVYNAFAGGQAGGFAGVGSGTDRGILHHELGHALSLPHWGDNGAYPYKGDMHGIQAPVNYNETHAGPAWAFHQPTGAFIPPTVVAGNVGGKPVGTYTVDPMQGGGSGWQPAGYLFNHFSDYSVNQMRSYLNSHVVVWNPALNSGNGSWAQYDSATGDYTTAVSNNGVQYPTTRDTQVISILATMSGSKPAINMVYPPIGPYTAGLIRLFDPSVPADRTAANSIYAPTNGCDYCVRVVQGGVTKAYMLPASALTGQTLTSSASIETEAVNLPAADGSVTRIELLSTPNVEDVGLPVTPAVLYTWAPLMPATGTFDLPPEANSSNAITMTAETGEVEYGYTGGTVEYLFTETSGNPGGTSSAWQTSRTYTDTGLQPNATYTYTVSMRAGTLSSPASAPVSATTTAVNVAGTIAVNDTQQFTVASGSGYKAVTGLGTFDAATADKLVVAIGLENANNDHVSILGVRYNGIQMIEAAHQTGGTTTGAVGIYYLDNPGPVGTGITVSGYNPNGGLGVASALSNTRPGSGAMNSRRGTAVTSAPLTTSSDNSLVIAAIENSGSPNSAGTPTANAPLTQSASGNWGSQWGSFAAGHQQVATPGAITPTFTTATGSSFSLSIAAVEFLAASLPASTWTQTAGGAQSWTTASNWIMNTVPTTVAGDTVDFSTVDIAANTTLTLGADRTGGLWKFGDLSGTETWTVNAGNTITLAGAAPTIEVDNNSAQLNNVVAGTAGLEKTGAGNLILAGSNTYTGGTTITAGTLTLNTTTALGGGTITLGDNTNNPYLNNASGSTLSYAGSMVWAGNFRLGGNWDFGTSPVSINVSSTQEIYGTVTIGGVISGTVGINKQGTGNLILNGLNTFTGGVVARQGTVTINTIKNYGTPSSLGAATTGSITIAPNNSTTLAYTGTGDTTNRPIQIGGTGSAGTTATVSNNGTGALIFTAAAFNTPVGITAGSAARVLGLAGSFGSSATPNEVQGVIADNTLNGATAPASQVSLSKSGTGAWKLSGANTYTGTTTISGGTLILGANNVLPSTTNVSIGAATLDADTRTGTVGTLNVTAAAAIRFGTGAALVFADSSAITWAGTLSLTGTFVSGSSLRFGTSATALTATQLSKISGGGFTSFSLNSSGYLVGSGSGATYSITNSTSDPNGTCTPTGVTSVSSGGSQIYTLTPATGYMVDTLTVNGASVPPALSYTFSNVTANQTISATFAPATNLFWDSDGTTAGFGNTTGTWGTSAFWSPDSSGASPAVASSTTTNSAVNFGSATSNYNQAAVTIAAGGVSVGSITFGAGQSTALTLSGGAITLFDTATLTVNHASTPITISSALTGASTSLTKEGAGILSLAGANTYSGNTIINSGTLRLGASNVLPDGAAVGIVTVNSTLDLNTFSDTVNALSGTGTVNTLAGGTPTLTIGANDTTSTFAGTFTNTAGSLSISKTGLGTLTLASANTHSGSTTISAGTLRLAHIGAVQNSSLVAVGASPNVLQLGTDTAFASSTPVSIAGGTITSDRATAGAGLTHAFGNLAVSHAVQNFTAGSNVTSGTPALQFASLTCAAGSGGTATLTPVGVSVIITGNATGTATGTSTFALGGTSTGNAIQGIIENGTRTTQNVTKSGTSTWTLSSGASTYTGVTTVTAGTLAVTKLANGGSGSSIGASANDATNLRFGSGGILSYIGTGDSTDRQITYSPNSNNTGFTLDASGSGPVNFTNTAAIVNTVTNQGRYFALSGTHAGDNTLAAQINNNGTSTDNTNLSKNGTGKWVLTNATSSFTGGIFINNGTLSVSMLASSGITSPIGAGTTIGLGRGPDSGTLLYTGPGHSTNRPVRIGTPDSVPGTGGGSIINDGSGALIFSNATFNTPVTGLNGSQHRTITFGGSYTGAANEIQGVIANNTASTGLVNVEKIGTGTWKFSGVNTYTGTTTLSGGTLALGASNVLPNTTAVSIGAATLNADTFTDTTGTLNVTAAATINLGAGAALAFADSSAIEWSGTLAITGTFVSGSSLRFGTSSTALTATQLGKISGMGYANFALDANGYLTATVASSFTHWATLTYANGTLPTNERGLTDDFDKDGLSNLLEFAIADRDPTLPNGSAGTFTGLTLTFTKRSGISGVTYAIEHSSNLGPAAVWTEVTGPSYINNSTTISYTIPSGPVKMFVRLRVTQP
ncbi:MAG: autotransporter-associated beta strand repeat-containing protein [Verrucomicrobiaceae bacterium]|nr:autotransporter-associated beta strand repeat-containing protein [Verrucomicrobiaceae bacterium]